LAPVNLHMSSLIPLWTAHMQHNQVGKNGSQSLNVSRLREARLNLMLFSKGRILYPLGCQKLFLLVGSSLPIPEAGRTTFMAYNGFIISMLRLVFNFTLQKNIIFFSAMDMTAISRQILLVTAFKIALSLFFFHLILPTSCNH
jgi:hypothetical protein